jgi:bacterioferritin-associated ferredoxin
MELDDELCLCFHVSLRKVKNFVRIEKPRRVGQMSECFGAGTGCGWCRPYLKRLFEQAQQQLEISDVELPDDELPEVDEYARLRTHYVKEGKGTPPPGATPIRDDAE